MKKTRVLVFALCLSFCFIVLSACTSKTPPPEPSGDSDKTTAAEDTQSPDADKANTAQKTPSFDEADVISKLDVQKFQYEDILKNTWICLVIKNNSEFDLNIDVNLTLKDESGNLVGAKSGRQEAFQSGSEIALTFMNDVSPASYDYEISAKPESWYECVTSDLTSEISPASKKAVIAVTNNGTKNAEFVEGTALFFKGDILVDHDTTYFTDNDNEIKAGKTITKEVSCYQEFDNVKVYFTGRRK